MATIRNEAAPGAALPADGRAITADITAPRVWADATLQYYLGGSNALTFDPAFREIYDGSPSDYFADGSLPDASFAYAARMVRGFQMIDSVIGLDFTRITDEAQARAQADIVLVTSDEMDSPSLEGFHAFPGFSERRPGDFWGLGAFNSSLGVMNAAAEQGGGEYLNWTLIHEVGHGLGIYHPFNGGGTLPSIGSAMNNERYTVMSYTGSSAAAGYGHAVTMMALDIAALQQQYGVESYATAASSYRLMDARTGALSLAENNVQIGRAYYAIWDSAGSDTISYAGSAASVLINLNDATLNRSGVASDAAPALTALQHTAFFDALSQALQAETVNPDYHAGGFFSRVISQQGGRWQGDDGGFAIAHGAQIENATGGVNADLLIGNELGNRLLGAGGNDVLIGSRGNDQLDGGAGTDIAGFSGARSEYDISVANGVVTVVHARGSRADGTDTLTNMEQAQFSNTLISLSGGFPPPPPPPTPLAFTGVAGNALLAFGANTLARGDDTNSGAVALGSIFANGIRIGDQTYSSLFVNTNGSISFGAALAGAPSSNSIGGGSTTPIIAPFYADVDNTTGPGGIHVDYNTARDSVVITWNRVGYYFRGTDRLNTFQLELRDRGNGDAEVIWRYGDIQWGNVGTTLAQVGLSLGDSYLELPEVVTAADLQNLENTIGNTGVGGVWQFILRDGVAQEIGTDGADTFVGTAATNAYFGLLGDDDLSGRGGNDHLYGGAGNDTLRGEAGRDRLYGGDGADVLNGGTEDDFIFGGATAADLRDVIYGGDGADNVDGGYGNDEIYGGTGFDTLEGGFGADTIYGQDGNDTVSGSAFGDLLFGGSGNDFINGGFGADRINGGTGADRFYHLGIADHGSDWLQDYAAAEGDLLVSGRAGATAAQFQVNYTTTAGAGAAGVQEAFIIYRPTGQIVWALVDGAGQDSINLQIGGQVFDLVA